MPSQAVQLNLFRDTQSATTEKTRITWSYSRRGGLERCLRQYYYDYYGSKVKLAPTDPIKQQLRELATLSNCHLRAGNLLHLAIRTYLKSIQSGADNKGLTDWVVRIFRQDRDFSKTNRGVQDTDSQQHSPTCLLEFYYFLDDADTLYEECEERLVTALTHFFHNDEIEFLRFGGRRPSAQVEADVFVEDNLFRARGKVDVAFRDSDGVTIADWKIRASGGSDSSLQLGFYALWGIQEYGCTPEDMTVYMTYLIDNELVSPDISSMELRRVRAKIIQDMERMTLLDPYGSNGVVEVFRPCNQPKVCALCRYQGPCLNRK